MLSLAQRGAKGAGPESSRRSDGTALARIVRRGGRGTALRPRRGPPPPGALRAERADQGARIQPRGTAVRPRETHAPGADRRGRRVPTRGSAYVGPGRAGRGG